MDQLIKHLQVSTSAQFDVRGNATPATTYTYYIGTHGPFQDVFEQGKDTSEAVMAKMQERIDKLRLLGAVS